MPQTFDQHVEQAKTNRISSPRVRRREAVAAQQVVEMLRQATLSTANLTGSPHWDRFLSYFQASVETTEAQRATLIAVLMSPKVVEQNHIMETKIAIAECDGLIKAWNAMIAFPNQIMEMHLAEKAKTDGEAAEL